ncbi:hypothetical protein [Fluviicola sp.]|uniref:hypothetical protein n=1 Tax=Fluviicola sp. TaxID=1917219 RepID=UPI0031D7E202
MMIQIMKFSAILIALLSFSLSCSNSSKSSVNNSKNESLSFPGQGTQCYEVTNSKGITHLRLSIDQKNIKGVLLVKNQVWGDVIHDFSGKVISDSVYHIVVHNISESTEQKWTLRIKNNAIEITGMVVSEITDGIVWKVTSLSCDKFPDVSEYLTIEDVETEIQGEESESDQTNSTLICYKSASSNAYKRTTLTEYIQLWLDGSKVSGRGAGYSEGDPEWNFSFEGTMVNDSIAEVKVNYTIGENTNFTTSEKWIMNAKTKQMRLEGIVKNRPGSVRYNQIEAEYIPEAFKRNRGWE